MRMLVIFHPFWYKTLVCYDSWILLVIILMFLIYIHHTSIHIYKVQNAMDCAKMHGKFVLLTMGEIVKEMCFQINLVLNLDIFILMFNPFSTKAPNCTLLGKWSFLHNYDDWKNKNKNHAWQGLIILGFSKLSALCNLKFQNFNTLSIKLQRTII